MHVRGSGEAWGLKTLLRLNLLPDHYLKVLHSCETLPPTLAALTTLPSSSSSSRPPSASLPPSSPSHSPPPPFPRILVAKTPPPPPSHLPRLSGSASHQLPLHHTPANPHSTMPHKQSRTGLAD